jgi:hypothetical protein
MVLGQRLILEVLAFDASPAAVAEAAVELVVVESAIRLVIQNVEFSRREWLGASRANEAGLVVATSQSAVGRRDALASNDLIASFARSSGRRQNTIPLAWW